jgi:hypothetical protein
MTSQAQLKEKVKGMLIATFGSVTELASERFSFPYESTEAFVEIGTWNEEPVVKVFAPVSRNVKISEELALRIMTDDATFFGEWEVWEYDASTDAGSLVISQLLLGENLDDIELKLAMAFIAHTANSASKWVTSDFGGTPFKSA